MREAGPPNAYRYTRSARRLAPAGHEHAHGHALAGRSDQRPREGGWDPVAAPDKRVNMAHKRSQRSRTTRVWSVGANAKTGRGLDRHHQVLQVRIQPAGG